MKDRLSDFDAIASNHASITPLNLDLTSYDDLKSLESWHEGNVKVSKKHRLAFLGLIVGVLFFL